MSRKLPGNHLLKDKSSSNFPVILHLDKENFFCFIQMIYQCWVCLKMYGVPVHYKMRKKIWEKQHTVKCKWHGMGLEDSTSQGYLSDYIPDSRSEITSIIKLPQFLQGIMVKTGLKKNSTAIYKPFFSSLLRLLTRSFTFQCSNVNTYTEETYISPNPAIWELLSNKMNCECISSVGYFITNVGQATWKELHIFTSGASSLVWFYHHNNTIFLE